MEKPTGVTGAPVAVLEGDIVRCAGTWLFPSLHLVEQQLRRLPAPHGEVHFELSGIQSLDTAGAWLLQRKALELEAQGHGVRFSGLPERFVPLMESVRRLGRTPLDLPQPQKAHRIERLGRAAGEQAKQYAGLLVFLGELAVVALPLLVRPQRIRWKLLLHNLDEAGYRAVPIVGLLSFLLGVVIAYQGGVQLRQYGADVFIADLVGLSMLRELSPLIAAIIVAGRTGSAYTAQIGTMQVTEEINALCAIGLRPMEVLVFPKVLALIVALTLLTVFADAMGILGGIAIAQVILGIGPVTFLDRVVEAVSLESFLVGIGKAPVFAAIIGLIGCYQGFRVTGGAEMVGRRTTSSVVQSIFVIIVVDAIFSVIFSELGI